MFYIIALIVLIILITAVMLLFVVNDCIIYKIQLFNIFNTLTTIFIAVYFYYKGQYSYIDIAILYAVLSYVVVLGYKKYFSLIERSQKK